MLNIVIPMAGAGSRFQMEGYKTPKPLIKIHDYPMIQVVVENLKPKIKHRFIFICQKEHIFKYKLNNFLSKISNNTEPTPNQLKKDTKTIEDFVYGDNTQQSQWLPTQRIVE